MFKYFFAFCLFSLIFLTGLAQSFTQVLRGRVIDRNTLQPLVAMSISIQGLNAIVLSDTNGYFNAGKLPIGKYEIHCTGIGYLPVSLYQVNLQSGKELVLLIEMEETYKVLKEVVVKRTLPKEGAVNQFALVGARTFGLQEALRYAGGFQDPARMSLAFAGVTTAGSDQNNEIIIRGNSPRGLLWRLEGIEIPNPNHFTDGQGSTSGIVSMINAHSLSQSDFMTGAFPANYGNGSSGVFDLNFRRGNNQHHEFAGQLSLVGLDFSAEGPFGKRDAGGSYRIAARYSTLELLLKSKIIDLSTNNYQPEFRDMNYTVEIPTKKLGEWTLWGIMGKNRAIQDYSDESNLDKGIVRIMGVTQKRSTAKTLWKNILSYSYTSQQSIREKMIAGQSNQQTRRQQYDYPTWRFQSTYLYKFRPGSHMEIGFIGTDLHYNLEDDRLNNAGKLVNYLKENDHAYFLQAFVQWKKRIHPRWVSTWGLHSYQFLLNGARTLEPRGSLQYTNSLSGKLSLGFGLHSRLEPVSVYLFKRYLTNGTSVQPNRELEPGKSFHYILSYEHPLNKNTRLKLEAYFQDLKQVPIDSSLNSTYTLLNSGGGIPSNVLLNKGFGKNKGLELTLEKFYTKQFYYLLTASVFDSKYKNQNGQWHNTVYNDRYAFNFLIGKEFTLTKHRSFALNIRYMHRGGNRFTPILLAESIKKNTTILDANRIYEDQYPDFKRCDLSFSYKINKKQSLWSMGMDIQNLTNRINIISQQFDIASKSIRNSIALPRIPIFFIRTEF